MYNYVSSVLVISVVRGSDIIHNWYGKILLMLDVDGVSFVTEDFLTILKTFSFVITDHQLTFGSSLCMISRIPHVIVSV